jgi:DNA-binding HxlR family transcriptional regulator
VEYVIEPLGETVIPLIQSLREWGLARMAELEVAEPAEGEASAGPDGRE